MMVSKIKVDNMTFRELEKAIQLILDDCVFDSSLKYNNPTLIVKAIRTVFHHQKPDEETKEYIESLFAIEEEKGEDE